VRGVHRFVEDLLRQRPTTRFDPEAADCSPIRTAIELRAAAPDRGPSAEFVVSLRDRLRAELDEGLPVRTLHASRRQFVTSIAAASAASAGVGAAVARAVRDEGTASTADPQLVEQTVHPDNGEWRGIVAGKDLPEGVVRPFDVGAMIGFVHRSADGLTAVSGICTHLGCKLALDGPMQQLNCPCHAASFRVDGTVLSHPLTVPLPHLPKLMVRESEGVVQVFVPPRSA
jgi:Rieske Fe-S protein